MQKEDILAKSRNENKDKDLFEKEVEVNAASIGSLVAAALATIFFTVQILVGKGMNYGLYAIVFAMPAASNIIKAIRMKRRRYLVIGALHTLITLIGSGYYLYELITAAASI